MFYLIKIFIRFRFIYFKHSNEFIVKMHALHLLFFSQRIILVLCGILQLVTSEPSNDDTASLLNQYSIRTDFSNHVTQTYLNQTPNHYYFLAPHRHHNPKRTANKRTRSSLYDKDLLVNTQSGYVRGRRFNLDKNFKEVSKTKRRRKYRLNAWLG